MERNLTFGAIEAILNKQQVSPPVLQILDLEPISSTSGVRYRVALWDGLRQHTYAMLSASLSSAVDNMEIEKFSVVKLDEYAWHTTPFRDVLVVLGLTVVERGSTVGSMLRNLAQPSPPSEVPAPPASLQHAPPASDVVPIAQLTPFHRRFTIRARVTFKSGVLTYENARGQGKRFVVHLLDESGEIRAVAFNQHCDRLFNAVEDRKLYYISNAGIKKAERRYSSVNNDYEMFFTEDTTVAPCDDATANIPAVQFSFVPLSGLREVTEGSVVDVIGVCKWVDDVKTVTLRKTNEERKKRDLRLEDDRGTKVCLTLWGEQAERFHGLENHVVAVKKACVAYFNGVKLSMTSAGTLHVDPDNPECQALSEWYGKSGTQGLSCSTSASGSEYAGRPDINWKCLAQAKAEGLGQGSEPHYYSVKAYVSVISKKNALYKACPSESCYKKVVDLENGCFRCEKCNRETRDFKWRPLISVTLADFSGEQPVTCFGKEGEQLIGKAAEELGELYSKSSNEDTRFEDILFDAQFRPFIFKLRVKKEFYNGEILLTTSAVAVAPVNYVEYTRKLLRDIAEMKTKLQGGPPRE